MDPTREKSPKSDTPRAFITHRLLKSVKPADIREREYVAIVLKVILFKEVIL